MAITRGLITVDDMRLAVYGPKRAATAPTDNDEFFEDYISAATPWIEDGPEGTGPMFAESRTVTLDGGSSALVLPFRFNTVTSLTVNGSATTNYTANGDSGIIYGGSTTSPTPFAWGTQNVVAVVTVGYATIPANVRLATIELCRLWWQNGQQAENNTPDVDDLKPGILGRVRALLAPTPDLPGFA